MPACRCQAGWGVTGPEERGRRGGWLTNWFAGGLLVWTAPVSRSSAAWGAELGADPLAGSLSTRQRAAGLVQQLSREKVCAYCFPCGCQRHKGSVGVGGRLVESNCASGRKSESPTTFASTLIFHCYSEYDNIQSITQRVNSIFWLDSPELGLIVNGGFSDYHANIIWVLDYSLDMHTVPFRRCLTMAFLPQFVTQIFLAVYDQCVAGGRDANTEERPTFLSRGRTCLLLNIMKELDINRFSRNTNLFKMEAEFVNWLNVNGNISGMCIFIWQQLCENMVIFKIKEKEELFCTCKQKSGSQKKWVCLCETWKYNRAFMAAWKETDFLAVAKQTLSQAMAQSLLCHACATTLHLQ